MGRERNTAERGERLTLNVGDAARLLGISRGLAYEMARSGKLPCVYFGRRILVSRWALERMLDQASNGSPPPQ